MTERRSATAARSSNTMRPILFGAICLALSLPANAQTIFQFKPDCPDCVTEVCDLFIAGHSVTFPPGSYSEDECDSLAEELDRQTPPFTDIKCECKQGSKV